MEKPKALVNWHTTLVGFAPLFAYAANYYGYWPAFFPPLPPIETVWPQILAAAGIGWFAKDNNVTGGTKQQ
jgi:hypothetical protein